MRFVTRYMAESILTVLFSAGLDSAVLLAKAAAESQDVQPVYVSAGLAWEQDEQITATRFVALLPRVRPVKVLTVVMTDVYPPTHWAIRGEAPAFDTPDSDVYLEGRNVILLSKAAVYMARIRSPRVLIGSLAGNPFPDSSRRFFDAMEVALSAGLAFSISIDAPFTGMTKGDVIRLGQTLGVPFELTLSCMQPVKGKHCGRCSKCRERRDAFAEAGVQDPARYAAPPPR
jgi:7-cyano-7-deazaguanine synthase